jgi:hypothetical protein
MTHHFGAYYQCYKQPLATEKCLEAFRAAYPDAPLILLSDNGFDYTALAERFSCIYIHSNENIGLIFNLSDPTYVQKATKLLDRLRSAFTMIDATYIMWLEDDVLVKGPVKSELRYDMNGFCPNLYKPDIISRLSQTYTQLDPTKPYRWTGHGGSIFRKDAILNALQHDDIIHDILTHWWTPYRIIANRFSQDDILSVLTHLNGGTLGPYDGHGDSKRSLIQHQYKVWYRC